MSSRRAALTAKESQLQRRDTALKEQASKLTYREAEIKRRVQDIEYRERILEGKTKLAIEKRQRAGLATPSSGDDEFRSQELMRFEMEQREKDLRRREEEMKQKLEELRQREDALQVCDMQILNKKSN